MVLNEDTLNTSTEDRSLIGGRKKWAVGVGMATLVVALIGLWLSSSLVGTEVVPVIAVAVAAIAGTAMALWLIEA